MKPETAVIDVFGKHSIYLEHYKKDEAAKTIIMVNGAFATTTSFTQTVRYLRDKVNVILFDLPYAGRSKEFNVNGKIVTKEDEVDILQYLIDRYRVNYLMSASWGGVSSLLSLARRPPTMEKAIIASFSPVINTAMRDYMADARTFLSLGDAASAAQLLNNTVGRYLSNLVKSHNFNYLLNSVKGNEEQLIFHINQIFEFDQKQYMQQFSSIDIPILFLNGELDEYTTPAEVRVLSEHIPQSEFAVIEKAGHFLDLESRHLWRTMSNIIREYFFESEERNYTAVQSGFNTALGQNLAFAEAGD
ncbi:alpha/beta fold hydrolase [Granulicella arctica]|uniref:Rhamnosyltransferase subunit A n=1 Tax=Granulicella arctica TaxID=940613 RepID=A0A7Y9PF78_9BACT|nr:alpha/beta hydrolase [Granulicella arctica]NYF78051.1 rhamnosyltransferase subunit A [Granulicella arctica]